MKSKETTIKHMTTGRKRTTSRWSGLQFRMTVSYALTTV